jgi:hypothetical protein
VILHVAGVMRLGGNPTIEIRNRAFRDALEAAGKLEN